MAVRSGLLPAESACVRVFESGEMAVGRSFGTDARRLSLDELVEVAGDQLREDPSLAFVVEAEEASPAAVVERVQLALKESGAQRIYLLAVKPDSSFQVCQLSLARRATP